MARKMEGHAGAMAGWRKWVGGGREGWSDQLSGGGDVLCPSSRSCVFYLPAAAASADTCFYYTVAALFPPLL